MLTHLKVLWLWAAVRKRWNPFKQSLKTAALLFAIGFGLSFAIAACSPGTSTNTPTSPAASTVATSNSATNPPIEATTVRVGYQKSATVLLALKNKGILDKAFAPSGSKVTWTEFPAGPPMLEALNAGSIDFGFTGESPPIFAQASGVPVRYVGYDPYGVKSEAIVVKKDSPIKKLEDLKGKKIGVAKGSNTHYLAVSALQSVGLQVSDVQFAFLKPAEGRAAFDGGNIDAWAIWDPYLAAVEEQADGQILADATGLAPNLGYYLAAQSFVEKSPGALKLVLEEVKKENEWAKANPTEVAKFLAPVLGLDVAVLEKAEKRRDYGLFPITDEVLAKQQQIADTFYSVKLIPKKISVREIVWSGNS